VITISAGSAEIRDLVVAKDWAAQYVAESALGQVHHFSIDCVRIK